MQAQCLTDCVAYRATVKETVSGREETYNGITGNTFKDRWNGHKSDTRNPDNIIKTNLSGHVWELKVKGTDHDIK